MGRTIIILGANFAGIPIAHYLLKHLVPKHQDLKVILVSPNTHMYWHIASVRALLPDMMPDEKIFVPIAPSFAAYPAAQFEFVLGTATALDPDAKRVTVSLLPTTAAQAQAQSQTQAQPTTDLSYDELVIATGSRFREDVPFKLCGTTEATRAALRAWNARVAAASSIVVGGAGATGVEVAGELGQEYAAAGAKEVTLVADGPLPFSGVVKTDVRETARRELERLGVRVLVNARVTSAQTTTAADGSKQTTVLELTSTTDGTKTSLETDLFVPAYGVVPNTEFVPRRLLNAAGFVKQTTFLQAEGYPSIFVVGDAGSLQPPGGLATDNQVLHVVKEFEALLAGQPLPEYKPDPKVVMGVSIGKSKGTGQMGGWRVWGFLVAWLKSRTLMTQHAPDFVAGKRTVQATSW